MPAYRSTLGACAAVKMLGAVVAEVATVAIVFLCRKLVVAAAVAAGGDAAGTVVACLSSARAAAVPIPTAAA